MFPVSFSLFPLREEKRGTQPPRVSNKTGEKRAEPAEPLPFPKPYRFENCYKSNKIF